MLQQTLQNLSFICWHCLWGFQIWPLAGQRFEFRLGAEWRRRSQLRDPSMHVSINTGWFFTHIQSSASMEVRSLSAGLTRLDWKFPAAPPKSEFMYLSHWDLLSSRRGALSAGSSLLPDSCANRQNIPPLHDLDVIVWLGGVVPTTGCTAAAASGLRGGRVAFNPRMKTTQPVRCPTPGTANYCWLLTGHLNVERLKREDWNDPRQTDTHMFPISKLRYRHTLYILNLIRYYRIHGAWPICGQIFLPIIHIFLFMCAEKDFWGGVELLNTVNFQWIDVILNKKAYFNLSPIHTNHCDKCGMSTF